ncbi:glycosyltransferase family 87 protein [Pseudarthrobacter sp. P1]|uniref:glycosyltransferase family 87 protein n=1 Tax=Pseudarthrobacter sp. P1 TaxID=3418418 RepID=UPI003CF24179
MYSPAFVAVIKPLALLPWPLFCAAWLGIEAAVLFWLVRPLRARWAIPVALLCLPELVVGNIYILLAATAVLGMRRPAAWSFGILTKITTGVGLLWFGSRGDWKRLLQGIGKTVLIIAVFYAVDPAAWSAWVQFLFDNRNATPDSRVSFVVRCLIAVALVVVGARKQWAFLVAPAMVLALRVLVGMVPWTILVAVPRLLMEGSPDRPVGDNQAKKRSPA